MQFSAYFQAILYMAIGRAKDLLPIYREMGRSGNKTKVLELKEQANSFTVQNFKHFAIRRAIH
jgi:hypothetical protein